MRGPNCKEIGLVRPCKSLPKVGEGIGSAGSPTLAAARRASFGLPLRRDGSMLLGVVSMFPVAFS